MFKLFLKHSEQNSAVLLQQVNRSWTIGDLKRHIVTQHPDINSEHLTIIFAGRELSDDLYLKDCDIDQQTTLFAVCKPSTNKQEDVAGYSSLQSQIEGFNNEPVSNTPRTDRLKPQLYVYCNIPCQSIQPGKLRVCCQLCKQGSFTVQQDPACWNDVLIGGAVQGTCQSDGCHGNTAEFYFKCANHPTTDMERSVVLQHIKTNTRQVMCITCGDIRNVVLVFPCANKHAICVDCFHDYCTIQLNDRRFIQHDELGYTLSCPSGCDDSFIMEIHHFKILGEEQYARYKRFAAEECVLKIGGVLCPSPGCGAGILTEQRRVECVKQGHNGCGAVFCKDCKRPYHLDNCQEGLAEPSSASSTTDPYQVDTMRAAQARWERQQSEDTILTTTKPCPKCKTPTERNGGCMHMTCTRPQCKFDWCWVCGIEWNHQCMSEHWFDIL